MSKRITLLTEIAIIAAIAMAMSFIPDVFSWYSPSFGTIPIVLFSLRRGPLYGLMAGCLWGLLHFPLGKVEFISINQVLLEYVVAFTCIGLAGLTWKMFQQRLKNKQKRAAIFWALCGAFIGVVTRYTCHYIAGVLFFAEYAKGMSPELYSLSVNGIAGLQTLLITAFAIGLLITTAPQLFFARK